MTGQRADGPDYDPEVHAQRALRALTAAGVGWELRHPLPSFDRAAAEVDLVLPADAIGSADEALAGAGFRRFRAPGHGDHRFYLAWTAGTWIKLDAKIAGRRKKPRAWRRIAGRLPVGLRRAGPVVGLAGTGAQHLCHQLEQTLPVATVVADLDGLSPWRVGARLLAVYTQAWAGRIVLCRGASEQSRTQLSGRVDRMLDLDEVADGPVAHAASATVWEALAVRRRWLPDASQVRGS